jgi:hypothetical protein
LVRYLHPTDEQLREIVGLPKNTSKTNRNRKENRDKDKDENINTFNVPRNISLTLEAEPLQVLDLIQLPYYAELQWLIDFGVYALIIYTLTEFYYYLVPNSSEYNLSLVWCSLVIAFSLYELMNILLYFIIYFIIFYQLFHFRLFLLQKNIVFNSLRLSLLLDSNDCFNR